MSLVTLSLETSVLLSSSSETSAFSVLVFIGGDPVDSGVSSDGLVVGVNEDDFEELEGSVLANPVRVEDSKVSATSANSLLSHSAVRSSRLELVDTLVDGLSVDNTLADWSLTASTSDSNSVNDVSLLGLVSELSGLVGSAWSVDLVDNGELSVLPRPHSHDESENITLLLSPELFKILVATHLSSEFIYLIQMFNMRSYLSINFACFYNI